MTKRSYIPAMNNSLKSIFYDALRISWRKPALLVFLAKAVVNQYQAIQKRLAFEKQNLHVPPFMILSITNACNLKCSGCYAKAHQRQETTELTHERMEQLFGEAEELGVLVLMLAGGEPLMRPKIFEITKKYPKIVYPIFTNGLHLTDKLLRDVFLKQRQLIPIISIEGLPDQTNARRGAGVHENFQKLLPNLKKHGVFFGVSLTVTKENFNVATDEKFIGKLIEQGCKLFFFIEYIPFDQTTQNMVPTQEQKKNLLDVLRSFRRKFPGLFIAFPGDEEQFGGCLASGRGFVHVSPGGDIEPCPFSPYTDTNLKNNTLREALRSKFLATIRENHNMLTESQTGCALWENREWVSSLLKK